MPTRLITFLISVLLIICTCCSKDIEIDTSTGTKLISIEYNSNSLNWMENYIYDSTNLITRIEKLSAQNRRYEIEYEDSRLKQYLTINNEDDRIIFKDSISYNLNNAIEKIYHYSFNAGADKYLSWTYEFIYDPNNKLIEKKTFFNETNQYTRIEKYYWYANNIERVDEYSEEYELYYSFYYTYDSKINYKKNIPIVIDDPINWSENNVTLMKFNDYVGILDLFCNPCKSTFIYNIDGYPTTIEINMNLKMNLTYE